ESDLTEETRILESGPSLRSFVDTESGENVRVVANPESGEHGADPAKIRIANGFDPDRGRHDRLAEPLGSCLRESARAEATAGVPRHEEAGGGLSLEVVGTTSKKQVYAHADPGFEKKLACGGVLLWRSAGRQVYRDAHQTVLSCRGWIEFTVGEGVADGVGKGQAGHLCPEGFKARRILGAQKPCDLGGSSGLPPVDEDLAVVCIRHM